MLMRAATVVQELCKSCRSCFVFYCTFYFTCDRSLSNFTTMDESCLSVIPSSAFAAARTRALTLLLASVGHDGVTSIHSHTYSHPFKLISYQRKCDFSFCARTDTWRIEIHQAGGAQRCARTALWRLRAHTAVPPIILCYRGVV